MRGNSPNYGFYAKQYNTLKSMGAAALACNALFIPEGFEHLRFLIKSFPLPVQTNYEAVPVDYPMGLQGHRTGVAKVRFEGSISVIETETGMIQEFSKQLTKLGGAIDNAKIIFGVSDGRSGNQTIVHRISDVVITFENGGEIDGSSREQILEVQANISYMYFGDEASLGNVGVFNNARQNIANNLANGRGASSVLTGLVNAATNALNGSLTASGFGGGQFNLGG